MIIYPAIELSFGRCHRLQPEQVGGAGLPDDDPVALARFLVGQGAEWLHIVNLDGPVGATPAQLEMLRRPSNILVQYPGASKPEPPEVDLRRKLPVNLFRLHEIRQATSVPIQFSGGLRTPDDIRLAMELGAERVVLNAGAFENPALVSEALDRWGAQRIVIGIDAHDGRAFAPGMPGITAVDLIELGHRMKAMGVERVIYTERTRDGALSGVNVGAPARLGDVTDLRVIAGGAITGPDDIEALKAHEHYNIEGVILGEALYNGTLTLPAAIHVGHGPLVRRSAGLVPYRHGKAGVEFLLLFNLFFEQWQFPRGGVHKGESDKACALREFMEETGSQEVRLGHENHSEARWLCAEETWSLLTETSPEQLPALDAALAYLRGQ
jgi:phosphoribosylformimino-5-aminoimidazole carboxamide ribotide isomerase